MARGGGRDAATSPAVPRENSEGMRRMNYASALTAGRARRYLVGPVLAALLTALLFPGTAFAVHDTGAFELDGNATSSTSDDWDKVCHEVTGSDCSTTLNTSGAKAVAWAAEPNPNSTIFS